MSGHPRTFATEPEEAYVKYQSASPGENAFIKFVGGENGNAEGSPGCTGDGMPVFEVAMSTNPVEGYELVCYANKVMEDGIYTEADCYAVIHGNSSAERTFDFEYTGDGDWINVNNVNHPQNGHSNDGPSRDEVFNNFENYVNDTPDTHVYAIFRKIGDALPRFDGYETVTVSKNATDGENNYATMYYGNKSFSAPKGIKAYTATVANGNVSLEEISGIIPENPPVILKTDDLLSKTRGFLFKEVDEADGINAANMLKGSDEATTVSGAGFKYYMLSLNGDSEPGSIGFYFDSDSNGGTQLKNGAHKAYLAVPEVEAAKGYPFGGDATGIEGLNINDNDNVNEVYDLQGRRVVRPAKGIYIVNGKKIVVK